MLFVDGLKQNLLSVSQVCDRGCEIVFTSKDFKIKYVSSGQLVAKGIRIENNVYVLKEENEECHKPLGKTPEDPIIEMNPLGTVELPPEDEEGDFEDFRKDEGIAPQLPPYL